MLTESEEIETEKLVFVLNEALDT